MTGEGIAWKSVTGGEWSALGDETLAEITREAMTPGNFALRLVVAEVYRLRKENARLDLAREAFLNRNNFLEQEADAVEAKKNGAAIP